MSAARLPDEPGAVAELLFEEPDPTRWLDLGDDGLAAVESGDES